VASGERNAVAEILGVRLSGFPAWWLWRTVYLLKSPSWSRRIKIAFDRTWELVFPRDLHHPRTNQTERISRAHYRPGDYIFLEGDPATHFYVIDRGEVEVLRRDQTGQPAHILDVLRPGEFFGEVALLDNQPRGVSAPSTHGGGCPGDGQGCIFPDFRLSHTLSADFGSSHQMEAREIEPAHSRSVESTSTDDAFGVFRIGTRPPALTA
jgi:hypothetical protein